ncbi:efflux RND transporter periplasmic adaptor subunit [Pacificimonas flava]|uniref:RND efflux system, membrane fusion protein CmeA n=1 Tax=Pacificimonas flava TaxID=1234595 RepID=M2U2G4_9SPHN|nr:efflux RND transporter periplasmic adaptor subunit [Pacificimonas flava]EMD82013.1 RND efflux system, membrane fusion protein CmeA [Pacificimonas flava]MBB5280424.1 membrane fusion protein (multidrug efflux system) [Pacificimonas flava]
MSVRTKFFPAALAILASACGGEQEQAAPPPPVVGTIVVETTSVPNIIELPGRVESLRTADVRARVTGIVERVAYEEGSNVAADQVLFTIDPREMRAAYQQAQATLQRAEASAANAQQVVERYSGLVDQQAISRQEYDAAIAEQRAAQASVAEARAAAEAARLNLSYTTVNAPIAGRAGRAQVREGALVSQTEATLMTRVEQLDPVYINFSQSTSGLLQIRRDIEQGRLNIERPDQATVQIFYEDGTPYGISGRLDFLDLTVAEDTGTVSLRAEVPNPERALLPGQFVRARIIAGEREGGIEIPQRAVQVAEDSASVFVVGENNIVAARLVELGPLDGEKWIIESGLEAGDRVIVDGLQKVQPGAPVQLKGQQGAGQAAPGGENSGTAAAPAGAASAGKAPTTETSRPAE